MLQMSHRANAERSRRAKTPTSVPQTIIKALLREPKPPFCRHIDPSALPLDPFLEPKRHSWSCIPRLKPFNCHPDPTRQDHHAPIQEKAPRVRPVAPRMSRLCVWSPLQESFQTSARKPGARRARLSPYACLSITAPKAQGPQWLETMPPTSTQSKLLKPSLVTYSSTASLIS